MPNDPYDALDLTKTATAADIKKAYRKLARTCHPDLHPDDPDAETRFKKITAAYEILKDPETRARYDAGEIDGSGAERPQRRYYRDFSDSSDNRYQDGFRSGADAADIFAEILRNRARSSTGGDFADSGFSATGPDARYSLQTSFLDAARGAETRITLPDGQQLDVRIPQGTEDGQTLRLRGKGRPGFGGGPSGDALITISVHSHPVFRRERDDILITLPITIDEAILGGKIMVPTIDGPVRVTIPDGASSGRILRLRSRGVGRAGKLTRGDQRIELRIVAPPETDKSLRDFLTEWRKSQSFDPRSDLLKEAGT